MYLLWAPAVVCLLRLPRAGETHRVGQSPLRCAGDGSGERVCTVGCLGQDWGVGLVLVSMTYCLPIFIPRLKSNLEKATCHGSQTCSVPKASASCTHCLVALRSHFAPRPSLLICKLEMEMRNFRSSLGCYETSLLSEGEAICLESCTS